MTARDPLDLQDANRNPQRVATEDEPPDLIEANDPDEGSDPVDPEGPIVDPIESLNPDATVVTRDPFIDPIEANDPDAMSPVNRDRDPSAAGRREGDSVETPAPDAADDDVE